MKHEEFEPLREELRRWQALSRQCGFWWRDHDLSINTPQFQLLRQVSEYYNVPVLVAVIPFLADRSLAQDALGMDTLFFCQHGFAHMNHEPEGMPKSEFGKSRSLEEIEQNIRLGREQLNRLFGERSLPVFVPPWGNLEPEVAQLLPKIGLTGLSQHGLRSLDIIPYWESRWLPRRCRIRKWPPIKPNAGSVPIHVNTHIELVDWKKLPDSSAPEISQFVDRLVKLLQQRREGVLDPRVPIGILGHHRVMRDDSWSLMKKLLDVTAEFHSAHWLSPHDLFCRHPGINRWKRLFTPSLLKGLDSSGKKSTDALRDKAAIAPCASLATDVNASGMANAPSSTPCANRVNRINLANLDSHQFEPGFFFPRRFLEPRIQENIKQYGEIQPRKFYVLEALRLVYLPVPKVACSSVKLALGKAAGISLAYGQDIHDNPAWHKQKGKLQEAQSGYAKFSFVRNPFDRLVSCYRQKILFTPTPKDPHATFEYYFFSLPTHIGFADFVERVSKIPDPLADNHFKSQYALLYDKGQALVDYVGKFEQLDKDWQPIAAKHTLDPQLEYSNSSKKKNRGATKIIACITPNHSFNWYTSAIARMWKCSVMNETMSNCWNLFVANTESGDWERA